MPEEGTGVGTATAPPAPQQTPPPQAPPTQVWGKFNSTDDAWKGLNEIRKTRGLPAVKPEGYGSIDDAGAEYRALAGNKLSPDAPGLPDTAGYAEIFAAAKLDMKACGEKFVKNGKLDEADYAAIKAVMPGTTKAVIDQHYKAEQVIYDNKAKDYEARVKQAENRVRDIAGGEDQWKNLLKFKEGLPPEVKADLDRRLDSFDHFEGAALELNSRHARETGADKIRPLNMGGMAASIGNMPQTFSEFKAMKERAANGDGLAAATLQKHSRELIAKFS